jgi:hypothetical protein
MSYHQKECSDKLCASDVVVTPFLNGRSSHYMETPTILMNHNSPPLAHQVVSQNLNGTQHHKVNRQPEDHKNRTRIFSRLIARFKSPGTSLPMLDI